MILFLVAVVSSHKSHFCSKTCRLEFSLENLPRMEANFFFLELPYGFLLFYTFHNFLSSITFFVHMPFLYFSPSAGSLYSLKHSLVCAQWASAERRGQHDLVSVKNAGYGSRGDLDTYCSASTYPLCYSRGCDFISVSIISSTKEGRQLQLKFQEVVLWGIKLPIKVPDTEQAPSEHQFPPSLPNFFSLKDIQVAFLVMRVVPMPTWQQMQI